MLHQVLQSLNARLTSRPVSVKIKKNAFSLNYSKHEEHY